jgi:hypothetical protein
MLTGEGDVWSEYAMELEMTEVDVPRRALHRSPQDWSSYNGFLSNASKSRFPTSLYYPDCYVVHPVQLCHALHGRQKEGTSILIASQTASRTYQLLVRIRQVYLRKHLPRKDGSATLPEEE